MHEIMGHEFLKNYKLFCVCVCVSVRFCVYDVLQVKLLFLLFDYNKLIRKTINMKGIQKKLNVRFEIHFR